MKEQMFLKLKYGEFSDNFRTILLTLMQNNIKFYKIHNVVFNGITLESPDPTYYYTIRIYESQNNAVLFKRESSTPNFFKYDYLAKNIVDMYYEN